MIDMICITGDTHGRIERICGNTALSVLGKGDYLIVCGDFGFVFANKGTMAYLEEYEDIQRLEALPYTILFVDGNHENFDRLNAYPVEEWNGGRVHRVGKNILHLMRGQVFEIEGKRILAMGGAHSIDKYMRTENVSWWSTEIPSCAELAEARLNLEKCSYSVDYVITHTAPRAGIATLGFSVAEEEIPLVELLDSVYENVSFKRWYFGHFHTDRRIDGRLFAMYNYVDEI